MPEYLDVTPAGPVKGEEVMPLEVYHTKSRQKRCIGVIALMLLVVGGLGVAAGLGEGDTSSRTPPLEESEPTVKTETEVVYGELVEAGDDVVETVLKMVGGEIFSGNIYGGSGDDDGNTNYLFLADFDHLQGVAALVTAVRRRFPMKFIFLTSHDSAVRFIKAAEHHAVPPEYTPNNVNIIYLGDVMCADVVLRSFYPGGDDMFEEIRRKALRYGVDEGVAFPRHVFADREEHRDLPPPEGAFLPFHRLHHKFVVVTPSNLVRCRRVENGPAKMWEGILDMARREKPPAKTFFPPKNTNVEANLFTQGTSQYIEKILHGPHHVINSGPHSTTHYLYIAACWEGSYSTPAAALMGILMETRRRQAMYGSTDSSEFHLILHKDTPPTFFRTSYDFITYIRNPAAIHGVLPYWKEASDKAEWGRLVGEGFPEAGVGVKGERRYPLLGGKYVEVAGFPEAVEGNYSVPVEDVVSGKVYGEVAKAVVGWTEVFHTGFGGVFWVTSLGCAMHGGLPLREAACYGASGKTAVTVKNPLLPATCTRHAESGVVTYNAVKEAVPPSSSHELLCFNPPVDDRYTGTNWNTTDTTHTLHTTHTPTSYITIRVSSPSASIFTTLIKRMSPAITLHWGATTPGVILITSVGESEAPPMISLGDLSGTAPITIDLHNPTTETEKVYKELCQIDGVLPPEDAVFSGRNRGGAGTDTLYISSRVGGGDVQPETLARVAEVLWRYILLTMEASV